ncbi:MULTISPECIES: metal/formaldehyde-sensitive transcriptional repressor [Agrobacterium]|jgi:DNA-binding FrmR family transcriptional regulator|uniref:metal/formaldehyde-sensitive transcriptional repressor n=1 Tax=Agrobacterium TaxID=357 RepID=UPI00080F9783|nr:metal/formaldehyde-sensitive transcriptional repressor [Agrobacterium sp. 13-2099-1-2]NSY46503.1 metal/formaldehyde-sensitive transcriptional repressor [Agrobacterium tumefaciens]UZX45257.1 metal/formaldehyde-sensitive transcriptional repressor [Agrobacterium sp. 13-2099-1-2]
MPYSVEDKKRATTRLRRIKGQVEALERAVDAGTECRLLLQQIAAMRGAAGGLMAEVLEIHMRETMASPDRTDSTSASDDQMEDIMKILRAYLK